ncbi:MAG: hypothetical protein V3U96_07955 [Paracoccaceae bacterium]
MLRQLVKKFQGVVDLPIEIGEIRDAVVECGIQDQIVFSAEELETGTLRGVFYQYTRRAGVYADPEFHTLIVYPENEDPIWQRVICAKELIHVCDKQIVRTNTDQEVIELANKVVGPFETESTEITDLMAATDKLAQYLALNLLFPKAARDLARGRIEADKKTREEIADWVQIPVEHVFLMLSEEWDTMSEFLVAIGNGEFATKET